MRLVSEYGGGAFVLGVGVGGCGCGGGSERGRGGVGVAWACGFVGRRGVETRWTGFGEASLRGLEGWVGR